MIMSLRFLVTIGGLKKKYKNLLTIIIPRHIERVDSIINELHSLNLKVHTFNSKFSINKDTDIFIVDAYGKTKSFYSLCKNVFLGGSLVNHGGQNPLEATRYGCNVLHALGARELALSCIDTGFDCSLRWPMVVPGRYPRRA